MNETARITDMSREEVRQAMAELGEPSFRARQIIKWLYQKRLDSFDSMTNIAKATRARLSQRFVIEKMTAFAVRESRCGDAVKFAYETKDGEVIESVLLYDGKRRTACISSQLGCALGCVFCATGAMGFRRNLSQGEILGQLIAMNDYLVQRNDKTITNVVFMGMGEALLNFDAFASAADIIMHEDGLCLGARRITVSTAGVVPGINRLRDSGLPVQLAISLNSYSDQRRSAIMPINKTYPLRTLVAAARDFAAGSQWPVTFEYVVISGENDTPQASAALAGLLRGIRCKINLISLNPGVAAPRERSGDDRIDVFGAQLRDRGFTVTIRQSRGRDIDGACGQLAGALTQES